MGLGNIQDYEGIKKEPNPTAQYGIMEEKSKGKDTTTGHWEMAGIISKNLLQLFQTVFQKNLLMNL